MLASLATLLAQVEIQDPGHGGDDLRGQEPGVLPELGLDNIDRYVSPVLQHLVARARVGARRLPVAFALALLSHRRRWLIPVFIGTTGILYTIPSIALLPAPAADHRARDRDGDHRPLALQPADHLPQRHLRAGQRARVGARCGNRDGDDEAAAALEGRAAAGASRRSSPALRIATVSTVAIATLAIFAGAGGLGEILYNEGIQRGVSRRTSSSAASSRSGWRSSSTGCSCSSSASPRPGEGAGAVSALMAPTSRLPRLLRRRDRLHLQRAALDVQAGEPVGGLGQIWDLLVTQPRSASSRCCLRSRSRLPIGAWLGHRGVGEFAAIAVGNAGRAIPELALIALMVAFIGVGVAQRDDRAAVLGIPPILTNAFVGMRQVDRGAVDAARGMGMTELEIMRRSSCRWRSRRSWAASARRR